MLVPEVREKIPVGTEHVPGHHIARQKLEQVADVQRAGAKAIDESGCAVDELSMAGGMFCGAGEASLGEDDFFVVKVPGCFLEQGVYRGRYLVVLAP